VQTFQIQLSKRRVLSALLTRIENPMDPDISRFMRLAAKSAGVAQQMRQNLIGDAEKTDRLLSQNQIRDPVAKLAADLEVAHMQLAESANRIGLLVFGGLSFDERHTDLYCNSLNKLVELHNQGVHMHVGLTGDARTRAAELLEPLHDELKLASRLFRMRFLGIF
jgi:hypothetical protein